MVVTDLRDPFRTNETAGLNCTGSSLCQTVDELDFDVDRNYTPLILEPVAGTYLDEVDKIG